MAAAELFYGGESFTRVGAMPITVLKLLQDFGSVQMLDGEAHRRRKGPFLSLVAPASVSRLNERVVAEWRRRLPEWARASEVVLFDEVRVILTRAVCAWAGVPLEEAEVVRRTRELSAMIESTGSVGLRNWRAQLLRTRAERWARDLVRQVRAGDLPCPETVPLPPLPCIAIWDGSRSTRRSRPSSCGSCSGRRWRWRALSYSPLSHCTSIRRQRGRIGGGDGPYLDAFAQEVRRQSPLFPLIGGRVRERLRLARALLRERPVGASRSPRDKPGPGALALSRPVPTRTLSRAEPHALRLRAAGRRRTPAGPPLPRRGHHR